MMDIKRFTLIAGIAFLVIGVLGFVPGANVGPHVHDPALAVDAAYGRILGLFPVNVLHNLVHLGLGGWAILASKNVASSIRFNRVNAVLYGVLAVIGLFPGLNTLFGLVPLFSHDVWLHAGIALATGYYGFVWSKREHPTTPVHRTGTFAHP